MAQYPGDSGSILRLFKGVTHIDVTAFDAFIGVYLVIGNDYLATTTTKLGGH